MPGAGRSDSSTLRLVGAVVFAAAVAGWALSNWSFGGAGLVPTVVGVGVAVVAVVATLYGRL